MYHMNDPLPQFIVAYYIVMGGLMIAIAAALLRPFYRPWPLERTCWFIGALIYFVVLDVMSAQTPYLYPDTRGAGNFSGVAWAIASLAFFMGLLPRPAGDPRIRYSKRADATLGMACLMIAGMWFSASITPEESGNRTSCRNNLKQIMLALHNDGDTNHRFAASSDGDPPHSWRLVLWPYLEHAPVAGRYQFSAAWDAPVNYPVATHQMWAFQCPSRERIAGAQSLYDEQHRYFSHYARITGAHTAGEAVSVKEITDGTSNTVMVVEACGVDRVWTNPIDVDIDSQPLGVNLPGPTRFHSPGWISSHHHNRAHVALADGSVKSISAGIDPKVLRAIVTIDGDEPIGDF